MEDYRHWRGNNYINKKTYYIISEGEYQKLLKEEKNDYALVPKFYHSKQVKWARKFLKMLPFPYENSIKKIEDYYMKEFETDFMHGFHIFCEDNNLWEDYLCFEEKEEANDIIKWCRKNKITYNTETYEERIAKLFLENISDNKKSLGFNYEPPTDFMNQFETYCKKNDLWEDFLEFQRKDEEEYWRQIFEKNETTE